MINGIAPKYLQEAYGSHHSPDNHLQSINIFAESFEYTKTLVKT